MRKALASVCLLIMCFALTASFAASIVPGIAFADSVPTSGNESGDSIQEQSDRYDEEIIARNAANTYHGGKDDSSQLILRRVILYTVLGLIVLAILYFTVIRKVVRYFQIRSEK